MIEKYYILKANKNKEIIETKILEKPEILKALTSNLGFKIIKSLSSPKCPIDLARDFGEHEQKIYYYIHKFRKNGLIEEVKTENRKGTLAKFYQVTHGALTIKLKDKDWERVELAKPIQKKSLEPFIINGKINFTIIVGSPDPHGPWQERALDAPTAIDLALFLGCYANEVYPNYKLDIEVREKDLKNNLILIGGPIVNMITKRVNKIMPIQFDLKTKDIISKISKNVYKDDQFGLINLIDNPWNKSKKILVFAGKRFPGTRATILAFIKNLENIMSGNRFDKSKIAKVVRGYDIDGDGVIDNAEIME
ncbi:MAG: hypothetical protein QW051_02650 [Candidatus Aenigmatarchaeota archaeon]